MNTVIIITLITIIVLGCSFYRSKKNKQPVSLAANSNFLDTFHKKPTGARTKDILKERLDKIGLSTHWDFFKSHLKSEILIEPKTIDEKQLAVGQSKIGGQPDLPKNVVWFKEDNGKRLSFIAQINLEEASQFDKSESLPKQGILYFFYSAEQETWGFDIKDKDKFKVYCYDGGSENLKRQDFPGDLAEHSKYKTCKLTFKSSVSLPNWEQTSISERLSKPEIDKYLDATEDLDLNVESNKLLGHSDNIQGPMELECQLVTNGLYCGDATGYNDPRAKELEKGVDNWTLLLQVDSNYEESGMMWGDVGRLYFWITKDDLKNMNFDHCWLILQCS